MHECPRCGQACDCHGDDTWDETESANCECVCDDAMMSAADDDEYDDDKVCHHCGSRYDGGQRCGVCGHGDPLDTGEFDRVTGEQI